VTRPATSEASAKKLLSKHDHSVAAVMEEVKEFKTVMKEKGDRAKLRMQKKIKGMISEAKDYETQVSELTDKLSQEDYDLFQRNSKRLQEKEETFNSLN
jgi:5'-3' exonuclease